tara:strand:- start:146 stop:391 length:246 start_codon:yes stop_codon:yes gene_type:complete
MNRSSKRRRQQHEPELRFKRSQRREIVLMITTDDMNLRLKQLADQGRQEDCLALMHELGDWQSYGRTTLSPILHAPFIGIS